MTSRSRQLFICALAALAGTTIVAIGSASAATVPAGSARQFYSVQSTGDRVFWFQRAPEKLPKRPRLPKGVPTVPPGTTVGVPNAKETASFAVPYLPWDYSDTSLPGAIFSRQLNSNVVETAYKPPRGKRIDAFKIRAGRIIIGLSEESDPALHPTEIVELKQEGAAWTTTPLTSRPGAAEAGNCGSSIGLLNVNGRGEVIVDDREYQGAAGGCKIVRVNSKLVAFAPDGSQRTMLTRTSAWGRNAGSASFDALAAGTGDWYITAKESADYDTTLAVQNLETGEEFPYPKIDREFYTTEINAAGTTLTMNPYSAIDRTLLFPDPRQLNHAVHLGRRSSITWFHLCENKIIEIARRRATKKHRGGSAWNVWIRGTDGQVQRRLGVRLARGTLFESCNENFAFFHHYLRKGKARQFAVPLDPPPPTAATGTTGPTP